MVWTCRIVSLACVELEKGADTSEIVVSVVGFFLSLNFLLFSHFSYCTAMVSWKGIEMKTMFCIWYWGKRWILDICMLVSQMYLAVLEQVRTFYSKVRGLSWGRENAGILLPIFLYRVCCIWRAFVHVKGQSFREDSHEKWFAGVPHERTSEVDYSEVQKLFS